MAKKIILHLANGEVWTLNFDNAALKKLEGPERGAMLESIDDTGDPNLNVVKAIYGDDIIGSAEGTGYDKFE